MDIIEFRDYCLSLHGAQECLPFDETTLVYKIGGKMFALASMENFRFFNVKCRPELAIELRERYAEVVPAFHCNKRHWNSVMTDGGFGRGVHAPPDTGVVRFGVLVSSCC